MLVNRIKAAITVDNKNIVVKISNKSKLLLIFKKLANLFIKSTFQISLGSEIIDKKGITIADSSIYILNLPKYRQQEGKYKNYPFRFWAGDRLLGGYSDHLAIKVDLIMN